MTTDDRTHRVAARLDHLFRTVYPAALGRPYSYREAAAKIAELAGGAAAISPVYLQQIRTGQRKTPSLDKLAWVAQLFGVPVTYFSDDIVAERVDAQLEIVTELRDDGVRELARLAAGLSAEALEPIKAQLRYARRIEGLPEVDSDGTSPPNQV
ncbi:helix-turn-helix domain-containing protein [Micromonospora sp. NPDC049751]|uniref:helix-turn-helix domain-containing protein n=1 Tax=Micromonospora sp. NPDC049751 TaxID=3154837 RepID=UPI0033F0BD3A